MAKSVDDLHSDSTIVGHHDRMGIGEAWDAKSWNSSHGSRGCSQDDLKGSGGAGLFYASRPTEAQFAHTTSPVAP